MFKWIIILSKPLLSISLVTYQVDVDVFRETITSLNRASEVLQQSQQTEITLDVIDNGNENQLLERLIVECSPLNFRFKISSNKENLGYGKGHNQSINQSIANYHLILNPDVILDDGCLLKGIECLSQNSSIVMLSPSATDQGDKKLFLCKQYPSIVVLLLRGFFPKPLQKIFDSKLSRYELRKETLKSDKENITFDPSLISGCFMLCRLDALQKVGGFDDRFFLYFEDFALSKELSKFGDIKYLPEMKIKHSGGYASKKGVRHILLFIKSSITFFNIYGWKFF